MNTNRFFGLSRNSRLMTFNALVQQSLQIERWAIRRLVATVFESSRLKEKPECFSAQQTTIPKVYYLLGNRPNFRHLLPVCR